MLIFTSNYKKKVFLTIHQWLNDNKNTETGEHMKQLLGEKLVWFGCVVTVTGTTKLWNRQTDRELAIIWLKQQNKCEKYSAYCRVTIPCAVKVYALISGFIKNRPFMNTVNKW